MEQPGPVCARCPRLLGRTCCEVSEGEQLATLTRSDVERIREHTRLPARAFSEVEWLSDEEARDYEWRRPLYAGYFRQGPGRLTLRRHAGACVFHRASGGCSLSPEVRPTACRLYPFELWPDGSWSLQVERMGSLAEARAMGGSACLAVEEAEAMEEVLAAFGTRQEEVEALGERLREEVRQHARAPGCS
jgi:Fe-S-cluster containining protein